MKKKISKIEANIETNETELAALEQKLLDTSLYESGKQDELQVILQRQGELKQQNEVFEEEWMHLHEELEVLEETQQI